MNHNLYLAFTSGRTNLSCPLERLELAYSFSGKWIIEIKRFYFWVFNITILNVLLEWFGTFYLAPLIQENLLLAEIFDRGRSSPLSVSFWSIHWISYSQILLNFWITNIMRRDGNFTIGILWFSKFCNCFEFVFFTYWNS